MYKSFKRLHRFSIARRIERYAENLSSAICTQESDKQLNRASNKLTTSQTREARFSKLVLAGGLTLVCNIRVFTTQ